MNKSLFLPGATVLVIISLTILQSYKLIFTYVDVCDFIIFGLFGFPHKL